MSQIDDMKALVQELRRAADRFKAEPSPINRLRLTVADKIEEWFNGRHRQAATAVQGDPANGAGGADARTAADLAARRAYKEATFRALHAAAGRAGAGVMAKMQKPPLGNWSSVGGMVGSCPICGTRPAGLGGMCASCASNAMGIVQRPCPVCGVQYADPGVACGPCTIKYAIQQSQAQQAHTQAAMFGAGTPTIVTPPLPRSDMQVCDLVGWRVWRITATGYLKSLTAPAIWLPGVPMEAETVEDEGVGANGVHVFADKRGAVIEVETYIEHGGGRDAPSYAIGSVLLWGEVVEHERGYRAERAKIKSIDDVTWKGKPPWDKETAEVLGFLRARYGVGLVDKEPSA